MNLEDIRRSGDRVRSTSSTRAAISRREGRPLLSGLALGIAAGLGAVFTPLLQLPRRYRGMTLRTQAMTVGLYALGGLAAGAMASLLDRPTRARALGEEERSGSETGLGLGFSLEPQTGEW